MRPHEGGINQDCMTEGRVCVLLVVVVLTEIPLLLTQGHANYDTVIISPVYARTFLNSYKAYFYYSASI